MRVTEPIKLVLITHSPLFSLDIILKLTYSYCALLAVTYVLCLTHTGELSLHSDHRGWGHGSAIMIWKCRCVVKIHTGLCTCTARLSALIMTPLSLVSAHISFLVGV